ncbi:hypothetical protein D3Y59_05485 [Hymenobacter oligotrophus]|uniref:Glycosyltransferase RgtA/B/C/D-like domain-containing protein n=1 Tax=Hymenobacter oligotrophus TaxID=2319843 RepID=A0A3B7RQX2_9BACT|nr:DUF6044 family protein [Hymenobacter oligotrophus]AYA36557.1 hypothetical protein D3Y59_05485 [Hymenobacter oligotrophus]
MTQTRILFAAQAPRLLALLALLLLWLPCVLRGPDSYVQIDDNLDAEIGVPYLLHRFDVALDYRPEAQVPALMNGLPRNTLRPGLSVPVALFGIFEPLTAYWVNQLLVRLVALLGLYALVRRYGLAAPEHRPLAAAVALAWAVLPAYTMYGLSALGTPWPLLAVLELRRRGGRLWWPWLVLLAFPLWSMLVLGGFFVVAALGLLLAADWLLHRRVSLAAWGGVVVLGLSYCVTEWPLIGSVLVRQQFVPHRLEFRLAELAPQGLAAGLRSTGQYLGWGQYHSSRFFRGGIALALVAAAWQLRSAAPIGQQAWRHRVGVGLAIVVALSVFCAFYPQAMGPLQRVAPALGAFNLTRFHFLTPLLWFGLWVLALRQLPPGALRTGLVVLQLAIGLGSNAEWLHNLRLWGGRPAPHEPTWRQFVAPELFGQAKGYLEQRSGQPASAWRVACLGMPPAAAQLNGFYTLDSYQNNYPLPYKHQFRRIVAPELAKSPELRRYFDAWGNRCYLFSAELGRNFRVGRTDGVVVQDFRFDAAAFRQMGGRYVLSAVQLAHPSGAGLQLIAQLHSPTAYWALYIYEIRT